MNNREIKFRLCHTAQNGSKTIHYTCDRTLIGLNGKIYENYGKDWKFPLWESVFDGEVFIQQYTGCKDKNGKEIYEGDIVSVLDENNVFDVRFGNVKRNIVGFDTNTIYPIEISCFYFHRDGLPHFSITKNHLGKHDLEDTEVIGNIFENKELLKGSNYEN